MEYLKVPYVRLNGKTYGGDLSRQEQVTINKYFDETADLDNNRFTQANSEGNRRQNSMYFIKGTITTFRDLYNIYKSGKDPAEITSEKKTEFYIPREDKISNPEKKLAIHDAITAIANKYGYQAPDKSDLIGVVDMDVFQKILIPNSYFISRPDGGLAGNLLIITDKDSIPTYLMLPTDNELWKSVDVDKSGNVLIPKDAYDYEVH